MVNLNDSAINELLELPETGMGFQFVDATFWGDRKRFLVFNSVHAIDITGGIRFRTNGVRLDFNKHQGN